MLVYNMPPGYPPLLESQKSEHQHDEQSIAMAVVQEDSARIGTRLSLRKSDGSDPSKTFNTTQIYDKTHFPG